MPQAVVEIGCADDCGRGSNCADELLGAYNLRSAKDGGIVGILGDVNANFAKFGLFLLVSLSYSMYECNQVAK